MTKRTDILELKFEGNGINPAKVKASEIAQLITDFEDAIVSALKNENPAIDTEQVLVCFEEVKNESIGIRLRPNSAVVKGGIKKEFDIAYDKLTFAISTNDYSSLSNDTIKPLRGILRFSTTYNTAANFKKNGHFISAILPESDIKFNKTGFLKGDTTIYGELTDAGGDNPNIHIKINNDYTVIIDTDKTKAKELASRLYEQVGLRGYAKWDIISSKILEFKLHEVLEYSPGKVSAVFSELRKVTSDHWDKAISNAEIKKKLLRD